MCISYFAEGPQIFFLLKLTQNNIKKITRLYEYKIIFKLNLILIKMFDCFNYFLIVHFSIITTIVQ